MSDAENELAGAASAYLRSARHQPIAWREWGAGAFAEAQRENKPVLLDIGAVWCHWCHVMDRESYENPETAAVINEHFVPVKVDRDERPDVDTRYQAAVQAISGQGGWPLTAFLTPDGKPYFGGTYFPPEDRYGRPSFRRVLLTMADAFQNRRSEVDESAGSIMEAIEHSETFSGRSGELNTALLEKLVGSVLRQFDERHGGFGSQPKFPHSGALDLLLDTASHPEAHPQTADRARLVAGVTLRKMAEGGIHDQLAGGFHRYSVDERWVVPHFEKMAYDNSELLKNYVHAYVTIGDPEYARVARGIVGWMDDCLTDREQGGFYASQDADDSLDDDGDYFTWTREEAAAVLSPEELAVAAAYYSIHEIGDMQHNPAKNVLHVAGPLEKVAHFPGRSEEQTRALLQSARASLLAARRQRRTPYVDRTIYSGWNGMCISAYLAAARALHDEPMLAFALRSLDRVLQSAWNGEEGLSRVVAYGEAITAAYRVPGMLEDYCFVATACLDAFEATGEFRFYSAAQAIADSMVARFADTAEGGFFDTDRTGTDESIGALQAKRKPLQDSPVPAGNSVAATFLLRLYALSGDESYRTRAEETLATFAGIVEHFGLYAASYGLALARLVNGPLQVCVVGTDPQARDLEATALAMFSANKSVIRLTEQQLGQLPPALAETLPSVPEAGSFALVCRGNTCLPPMRDADELARALRGL